MESLTLFFSISYLLWLSVDKPSGMVDATRGNLPADAAVVAVGAKTYIASKKARKNTDLGIIPSGGVQRGVKIARRASANRRNRGCQSAQQDRCRLWQKFQTTGQRRGRKSTLESFYTLQTGGQTALRWRTPPGGQRRPPGRRLEFVDLCAVRRSAAPCLQQAFFQPRALAGRTAPRRAAIACWAKWPACGNFLGFSKWCIR